jgi:hypothetical protein
MRYVARAIPLLNKLKTVLVNVSTVAKAIYSACAIGIVATTALIKSLIGLVETEEEAEVEPP